MEVKLVTNNVTLRNVDRTTEPHLWKNGKKKMEKKNKKLGVIASPSKQNVLVSTLMQVLVLYI